MHSKGDSQLYCGGLDRYKNNMLCLYQGRSAQVKAKIKVQKTGGKYLEISDKILKISKKGGILGMAHPNPSP